MKEKLGKKEVIFAIGGILVVTIAVILFIVLSGNDTNDNENTNNEANNIVVENNIRPNVNPGIVDDQIIDGLIFKNTSLVFDNGLSKFTTTVENTTKNNVSVRIFEIYVKDSSGNVLVTLQGYVGGEIPAGEARTIKSGTAMDLTEAASVEYKLIK